MLTKFPRAKLPARQNGVVLLIALIVLVALTLTGIALVRSVNTTNIIAGNMAFQQSATQSGDAGIEAATAWLTNNAALNNDDASNGYASNGNDPAQNPDAGESWDAYWTRTLAGRAKTLSTDAAGNTVSYVIDRLCAFSGSLSAGARCTTSPVVNVATGNPDDDPSWNPPVSVVYYRITSRIAGPRNTVSYVQTIISM